MKRCLPMLLLSADDLVRLTLLRSSLAESSRYRAAVAGVVEYDEASEEALHTGDDIYGRPLLPDSGDESWEMRSVKTEGGSYLLELPPGRHFAAGPLFPPGDSLAMTYDWHIRAIAQQWGVPEWLVKGASAGASFSDSLTAESPSVVEFETEQAKECRYTKATVKRELEYRIEVGQLPETFFDEYDIDVQADSVITRDSEAEMNAAVQAFTNGFASKRTCRVNLGYDPDKEEALCAEEETQGQGPQELQPDNEGSKGTSTDTTDGKRQQLEGGKGQ